MTSPTTRCLDCSAVCRAIPLNPRKDSELYLLTCTPCDRSTWTSRGAVVPRLEALRMLAGKPHFELTPVTRPKSTPTRRRAAAAV